MDKMLKQKLIFLIPMYALLLTFGWGNFMEGTVTATKDIIISSVNVTPNKIYIKGLLTKGRQVTSYGFGYKPQNRLYIDVRSRPNVFSEGERNIVLDEDISNIKQIYLRGSNGSDVKLIWEKAPAIIPTEIEQRLSKNHPNTNEMQAIWQQLGIKERQDYFGDSDLKYKRYDFKMNNGLTYAVIQVSDVDDFDFQDLIFVNKDHEWVFAGNVDMPAQKGLFPEYGVINQQNHSWLAVKYITGSGSGYLCQQEAWYDFYDDKLHEVIRYTSDLGVDAGGPLATTVTGTVVSKGTREGVPSVTVKFKVDYCFDKPLISAYYTANYLWSPSRREFVFDQENSDCSLKQITDDFILSDVEFFSKYNKQLLEISKGNNQEKKDQLKGILDNYDNPSKRNQLRQRFGM